MVEKKYYCPHCKEITTFSSEIRDADSNGEGWVCLKCNEEKKNPWCIHYESYLQRITEEFKRKGRKTTLDEFSEVRA